MKRWVLFFLILPLTLFVGGQHTYAPTSVLAEGKWVKIATSATGVYKVTASFLSTAGFVLPAPSSSIRLFGHGGEVLPEAARTQLVDDLPEQQIDMKDGGDGVFDGDDYFLFYAPGVDQWKYLDSAKRFIYVKNHYSDKAFYFIQLGGNAGKRIAEKVVTGIPTVTTTSFVEHLRLERDSLNFLNSGREWYGEAFGNGSPNSRTNPIVSEGVVQGSRYTLTSEVVGRSFDNPNKLTVTVNGNQVMQHSTPPSIGTLLEPIANVSQLSTEQLINETSITVRYDFLPGSANGQIWLNWLELFFRKQLRQSNDSFLSFRDPLVAGAQQVAAFQITSSNPQLQVWEVTTNGSFVKLKTEFTTNTHRFIDDAAVVKEYISFDPKLAKQPTLVGPVPNQNLHGEGFFDMIVVADASMKQQARRLAEFRQVNNGLRVLVADAESIYNEFSSGMADPTAIRNFVKMFFDRAGNNPANRPKYLLLFGGTSYQFKETATDKKNLIPSYQSPSSLDPLTTYVSDDYFGYLDDGDDINTNLPAPMLDLAVGRIPVRSLTQARMVVDKLIAYQTSSAVGPWRNEITLVADDEDVDLHFKDAEAHAAIIEKKETVWNLNKIYLDAFQQSSGTGGARYPAVNAAINKGMDKGTLIWNYSGHGGNTRLAQEAILEKEMIAEWNNQTRLPLFVTATCDFAPFDNPAQFSIGEDLLMGRSNGAIGLVTTTRLVFASSNKLINSNFLQSLLAKKNNGRYPTLGEAWLEAKNNTVQLSGDYINARKFAMLGDPAMKLLMPEYQVKTSSISNAQTGLKTDTLSALNKYRLEGEVFTPEGNPASDFNGTVDLKIFDKAVQSQTLANDPQSSKQSFRVYDNLLYNGKQKVQNGKFTVDFIVPENIRLNYGQARINYYAVDDRRDAQGVDETRVAGGFGGQVPNDNNGPVIKAFINDEQFSNGSTVKAASRLIVQLADQSGIYLGRFGIGQDIQLVIDGDYANAQVLNDYFQPVLGNNKAGEINLSLPALSDGLHKIELKAWDVFNNSSSASIDFKIKVQKQIEIETFYNYPNPFSGATTFSIAMNGPTAGATLQLEIFSIHGQSVKTITETINQNALRSIQVMWNGMDVKGKKPDPGMYVARLVLTTPTGEISSKVQKLILR